MSILCAKCRKPEVIGEVSIQRKKTHIKLYFCSNACSKALAKALPKALKTSPK
jgi:hypothetical protein